MELNSGGVPSPILGLISGWPECSFETDRNQLRNTPSNPETYRLFQLPSPVQNVETV
jgi:hypothetical protein